MNMSIWDIYIYLWGKAYIYIILYYITIKYIELYIFCCTVRILSKFTILYFSAAYHWTPTTLFQNALSAVYNTKLEEEWFLLLIRWMRHHKQSENFCINNLCK